MLRDLILQSRFKYPDLLNGDPSLDKKRFFFEETDICRFYLFYTSMKDFM